MANRTIAEIADGIQRLVDCQVANYDISLNSMSIAGPRQFEHHEHLEHHEGTEFPEFPCHLLLGAQGVVRSILMSDIRRKSKSDSVDGYNWVWEKHFHQEGDRM
jgi:hypothetical protein